VGLVPYEIKGKVVKRLNMTTSKTPVRIFPFRVTWVLSIFDTSITFGEPIILTKFMKHALVITLIRFYIYKNKIVDLNFKSLFISKIPRQAMQSSNSEGHGNFDGTGQGKANGKGASHLTAIARARASYNDNNSTTLIFIFL